MRITRLLLLVAGFYIATPPPLEAQAAKLRHPDRALLSFSIKVPASRPDLSVTGLLIQAGMGLVGGVVGATAMAIPMMMSGNESLGVGLVGVGWVGGTTAGIHLGGKWQEMRGNPWVTAAGVLVGTAIAGASMQVAEGEPAEPAPLVFITPGVVGTAAYTLTRRAR